MADDDGPSTKGEDPQKRLTRNLNELLQELRVTQTGVQILTGFLLTLPFTTRFTELDDLQQNVYLAILCGSVVATGLIVSPVALHRALFRQGERHFIVAATNQLARAGLLFLALTTSGVVWLVFDVVTGRAAANIAGLTAAGFFLLLWAVLPLAARHGRTDRVQA